MFNQENSAFDFKHWFQIENKYVDLVGSEKLYQKLYGFPILNLIKYKCYVHRYLSVNFCLFLMYFGGILQIEQIKVMHETKF